MIYVGGPVRVKHIAAEFSAWLIQSRLRFIRPNNRVDRGAPHFLILFPGGVNVAVLLQRGDDRAESTEAQIDYIDFLQRAGWRTCVASGLEDAIGFVEGVRGD